jgi:ATP-binding cassette subfamily F protein uup
MASSFIQIESLTKSFGDRLLFADVTFGIYEGDKIGIIAKNGTGKSTMLRIIAGLEAPDSGTVTMRSGLRVGMLEQSPSFPAGLSILDALLGGDDETSRAIAEYERALADDDHQRLDAAMQAMDRTGAWAAEDRVRQMLGQLGIHNLNQTTDTLSGGQAKRVALGRMLLTEPDIIILDEPTNHLDIAIIEWLENYLKRQRITLLMVTHDRYFLDRVTTKIIEIDNRQIFVYEGNYDYYLRRRRERIEALEAEKSKLANTLRREQEWMRRQPQARAGKAQYRIDSFHAMKDRHSAIDLSDPTVKIDVKAGYIGSKIFEAEHISKRFDDKIVLRDFTYTFARRERVGIIGPNGVGKSTFIKMLMGIVPQDTGQWNVGTTVRFGYYSQEGITLDPGKKVIDAVTDLTEDIVVNDGVHYSPMQFLTRFLFSPADQQKYVATLSGGERARLHLAVVLMRSPNFLILDEPTNDLDIVTLGILEDYLSTFDGCLIVVSHDRFFLDSIVDHLFVFEGDGVVRDFPGNYTEYRDEQAALAREQQATERQQAPAAPPRQPRQQRPDKMTFRERKEFETLTADIDALTAEKASLDALFNSGQVIDDVNAAAARYQEVTRLLDEKELRWLELSEKS